MESHRLVESDAEASVPVEVPSHATGASKKVIGVASAVGLFCTGMWAGDQFAAGRPAFHPAAREGFQQLTQIIAKPKRGSCSRWNEDCMATGCCDVVGYTCFATKPGKASCLKNCTPSATQSCTQPQNIMNPILQDAVPQPMSLYCFSVYTMNTGTTKPNYELDIIKEQFARKISIFACEQSDVFSDVEVAVGSGLNTIRVEDKEGDFHWAKRKVSGAWVNTGMFTQVWKAVKVQSKYQSADWVAKVDADAVFVPSRLVRWVQAQSVPARGIYLENCKFVDYGYFGNLEVFSRVAFSTLLENMDTCKQASEIHWKVGIKNGKYGPMGEDLFAQACLDLHGVRRVEAFDITTDGACPADRPLDQQKNKKWKPNCAETSTAAMHPFKKKEEWFQCWEATTAAFGQ